MKTFPELRPSSVTVQLGIPVLEDHLSGLQLTCLSTIPAYLGHHARHFQYADHRAHTITVEVLPNIPEPAVMSENLGGCSRAGGRHVLAYTILIILMLALC